MSYKTKVEEMTGSMGSVTGYTADTTMDGWLKAVTREIVSVLPVDFRARMTKTYTDSGSGITVGADGGGTIIYAHKANYRAQRGIAADKARYASGSIYAPTATSPIYYVESGTAFMLPGGGTFEILHMPVIISTDSFGSYSNGDTVIPEDMEHVIVTGTAVKAKNLQVDSKRREIIALYPVVALDEHPSVQSPVEPVLDFSQMETFMADEDTELITGRGEVMGRQLEDFNAKLKGRIDKFGADMQVYASEIDSAQKKSGIESSVSDMKANEYTLLVGQLQHLSGQYMQELKMLVEKSVSGARQATPAAPAA